MEDGRAPVMLITGASSGIGAGLARHAVERGHRVSLLARRADALAELADELGEDRALALPGDVTEWDALSGAVQATIERFGRIDVAVANAGVGGGSSFLGGDDTPDTWRRMVLINVYGAALTARATLPALVDASGHLVLIGSVAGRVAIRGSLYSATKWAVTGMAQSIRDEVFGTGVRVTVVEPGKVDTPWFDETPPDSLDVRDVTNAVLYAVSQPPSVDVNEILLRPTDQRR